MTATCSLLSREATYKHVSKNTSAIVRGTHTEFITHTLETYHLPIHHVLHASLGNYTPNIPHGLDFSQFYLHLHGLAVSSLDNPHSFFDFWLTVKFSNKFFPFLWAVVINNTRTVDSVAVYSTLTSNSYYSQFLQYCGVDRAQGFRFLRSMDGYTSSYYVKPTKSNRQYASKPPSTLLLAALYFSDKDFDSFSKSLSYSCSTSNRNVSIFLDYMSKISDASTPHPNLSTFDPLFIADMLAATQIAKAIESNKLLPKRHLQKARLSFDRVSHHVYSQLTHFNTQFGNSSTPAPDIPAPQQEGMCVYRSLANAIFRDYDATMLIYHGYHSSVVRQDNKETFYTNLISRVESYTHNIIPGSVSVILFYANLLRFSFVVLPHGVSPSPDDLLKDHIFFVTNDHMEYYDRNCKPSFSLSGFYCVMSSINPYHNTILFTSTTHFSPTVRDQTHFPLIDMLGLDGSHHSTLSEHPPSPHSEHRFVEMVLASDVSPPPFSLDTHEHYPLNISNTDIKFDPWIRLSECRSVDNLMCDPYLSSCEFSADPIDQYFWLVKFHLGKSDLIHDDDDIYHYASLGTIVFLSSLEPQAMSTVQVTVVVRAFRQMYDQLMSTYYSLKRGALRLMSFYDPSYSPDESHPHNTNDAKVSSVPLITKRITKALPQLPQYQENFDDVSTLPSANIPPYMPKEEPNEAPPPPPPFIDAITWSDWLYSKTVGPCKRAKKDFVEDAVETALNYLDKRISEKIKALGPQVLRLLKVAFAIYILKTDCTNVVKIACVAGCFSSELWGIISSYVSQDKAGLKPHASGEDASPSIVSMILNVFGVKIPAALMTITVSMVRDLGSILSTTRSLMAIIAIVLAIAHTLSSWFYERWIVSTSESYKEFRESTDYLFDVIKLSSTPIKDHACATKMLKASVCLTMFLKKYDTNPHYRLSCNTAKYLLSATAGYYNEACSMNSDRMRKAPPMAIYLTGEPGVGKSTVVTLISKTFYQTMKTFPDYDGVFPYNDSTCGTSDIYNATKSEAFPGDEYTPRPIAVFDDCLTTTERKAGTALFTNWINLLSRTPAPLLAADPSLKGKKRFDSDLLVATGNHGLDTTCATMIDMGAVRRRFDILARVSLADPDDPTSDRVYTIFFYPDNATNVTTAIAEFTEDQFLVYVRDVAIHRANLMDHTRLIQGDAASRNYVVADPFANLRVYARVHKAFLPMVPTPSGATYPLLERPERARIVISDMRMTRSLAYAGTTHDVFEGPDGPPPFLITLYRDYLSYSTARVVDMAADLSTQCWNYFRDLTPSFLGNMAALSGLVVLGVTTVRWWRSIYADDENVPLDLYPQAYDKSAHHRMVDFSTGMSANQRRQRVALNRTRAAAERTQTRSSGKAHRLKPHNGFYDSDLDIAEPTIVNALFEAEAILEVFYNGKPHLLHCIRYTAGTYLLPSHYQPYLVSSEKVILHYPKKNEFIAFDITNAFSLHLHLGSGSRPQTHVCVMKTANTHIHGGSLQSAIFDTHDDIHRLSPSPVSRYNYIESSVELLGLPEFHEHEGTGFIFPAKSQDGDCGMPYFINKKDSRGKFLLGFHTHGNDDPSSYMTFLTNEDITAALTTPDSMPKFYSNRAPVFTRHLVQQNALFYKPSTLPPLSSYRPTSLFGVIQEPLKAPIDFKNHLNSLNTIPSTHNLNPTDSRVLAQCVAHFIKTHNYNVTTPCTILEAFGINSPLGPIARDTSSGYTGAQASIKADLYVSKDPSSPDYFKVKQTIFDYYVDYETELYQPLWKSTQKDEARSFSKLADCKTRLIYVAPWEHVILGRRFIGPVANMFQQHKTTSTISIGVNPFSSDWTALFSSLNRFGESSKFMAGDKKSFDTSIPYGVMSSAFDVIKAYVQPVNHKYIDHIFTTIVTGHHTYLGVALTKVNGNSSGGPYTSFINSICNTLMSYYCILKKSSHPQPLDHIALHTYGDDDVMSIDSSVLVDFNMLDMKDELAKIGVTYTSAHKEREITPFMTMDDIIYLQRSFVPHQGRVSCPRPIPSILDQVQYHKTESRLSPSDDSILIDGFVSMCIELSQHGEQTYNTQNARLVSAYNSVGIVVPTITYKDMIELLYFQTIKGVSLPDPSLICHDDNHWLVDHINQYLRNAEEHRNLLTYPNPQSQSKCFGTNPLRPQSSMDEIITPGAEIEPDVTSLPEIEDPVDPTNHPPESNPLLNREWKLRSYNISPASTGIVVAYDIGTEILLNKYISNIMKQYKYVKTDVEFTVRIAGTASYDSFSAAAYVPFSNYAILNDTLNCNAITYPYYQHMTFNTVEKANHTLRVSPVTPRTGFDTTSLNYMGHINLINIHPLMGPTDNSESVSASVYMKLTNVKLMGRKLFPQSQEAGAKSKSRSLVTKVREVADPIMKAVRFVGDLANPLGSVLNFLDWQQPNDLQVPTAVIPAPTYNPYSTRGLTSALNMCMSPDSTCTKNSDSLVLGPEEGSIASLISRPGVVSNFSITSTTPSILYSSGTGPKFQAIKIGSQVYSTPLRFIASQAATYSGSMTYKLVVTGSPFSRCSLQFTWTPEPWNPLLDPNSYSDQVMSTVVDFTGSGTYEFQTPGLGLGPRTRVDSGTNGYLTISIVNPPFLSGDLLSSSFQCTLYSYASPDFKLYHRRNLQAQSVPFLGAPGHNVDVMPWDGEYIEHVKDLLLTRYNDTSPTLTGLNPISTMFTFQRYGYNLQLRGQKDDVFQFVSTTGIATGPFTYYFPVPLVTDGVVSTTVSLVTPYVNPFPFVINPPWVGNSTCLLRIEGNTGPLNYLFSVSDDAVFSGFIYPGTTHELRLDSVYGAF